MNSDTFPPRNCPARFPMTWLFPWLMNFLRRLKMQTNGATSVASLAAGSPRTRQSACILGSARSPESRRGEPRPSAPYAPRLAAEAGRRRACVAPGAHQEILAAGGPGAPLRRAALIWQRRPPDAPNSLGDALAVLSLNGRWTSRTCTYHVSL